MTNTAGNIIESYDYKVYGERTSSVNGLTDVGYTGQRHDSETGLMYFKNRYYSVSMGSFVTRDPLGYVDGLSMYLGYFGGQSADWNGLEYEYDTNDAPYNSKSGLSGRYLTSSDWTRIKNREEDLGLQGTAARYYYKVTHFKLYSNLKDWEECADNKSISDVDLYKSRKIAGTDNLNASASKEIADFIKSSSTGSAKLGSSTFNFSTFSPIIDSSGSSQTTGGVYNIQLFEDLTNRQAALISLHEAVEREQGGGGSSHAYATYIELVNASKAGVSTNFIRWRMNNLIAITIRTRLATTLGNASGFNSYLQKKEVRDVMELIINFIDSYKPIQCGSPCKSVEQENRRPKK